eukprot:scaffold316161_cov41-Prasinocladus_malaysianus.AAC.1
MRDIGFRPVWQVSKEWMKSISGKFPDRLVDVEIDEDVTEFSASFATEKLQGFWGCISPQTSPAAVCCGSGQVGLGEKVWLSDEGIWWLSQKTGGSSQAPIGILLAAILCHYK